MSRHTIVSLCLGVWLAMIPASASRAGFTNGDFEGGTFTGWDVEFSYYHSAANFCENCLASFDPCDSSANRPPCNTCLNQWTMNQGTHPAAVTVGAHTFAGGLTFNALQGTRMARIGDLDGCSDVTRLSQRITIQPGEVNCMYVHVEWGAALEDAGHPTTEQPFFAVQVRKKKGVFAWETIGSVVVDASQAGQAGSGWQMVQGVPGGMGTNSPVFFSTGVMEIPLHDIAVGDEVEVILLVTDCSEGGHGAMAFLDNVSLVSLCANDCLPNLFVKAPLPFIPNAFTPNNDGLNDVWRIYGVTHACWIHVEIWNRWGQLIVDRFFDSPAPGPFYYAIIDAWDGTYVGSPVQQDTYVYRITLQNCANNVSTTQGEPTCLTCQSKVTLIR